MTNTLITDMTTDTLTARPSVAHGAALPATAASGVLSRYEDWVRRSPQAPAVVDGGHTWSYRQLDEAADELVRALDGRVRPGDIVGVCLDRSAALAVTAVALARLGAVYLPLGPRPGERRIGAVTEDVAVVCLMGDPAVLPAGHRAAERIELPLPVEGTNAAATVVAAFAPPAAAARPAPPEAFYAVLTSGSTGRPKALAVAEPALATLLDWYRAETGLAPGDRQSLLIGVAFDPHVLELWAGLTSGAALVPAPDAVRWDPAELTDWWRDAGVTVCVAATPMAEPVLDRPWPRGLRLRHLVVGGDRMRRRPGPDVTATVHNAYGPAEATVITTTHAMRATDAEPDDAAAPPIGSPLPGTTVVVAGQDGRIAARGETGELLIGGACLAIGDLDPELTARRFTAPPEGLDAPGADRFDRTGDRVRMLDDGQLEFLGRLDDQVKISGVRIEPAEVEAAFEQDPAVRSAVVTAPRSADGRTRLVGFVPPAAGAAPPTDALLSAVRVWLPEQAVPSTVRIVEAFPLDANGKVDRAALLAGETAEAAAGAATSGSALPDGTATDSEQLVLRVVRDLLDRPDAALEDNFTSVGGTSIIAARLLAAIERETGTRLRAPEVLRQPDLRAVAAVLDKRRATASPAVV
ncbi:non-ribosomal peptide synthetase [Streptomyces sp. H39-C1]|uniref:non-ribosomal peptide synthetase n=1 Tax=Streptomyces sp. H39-C1 TaxID=3004355 RepID=UPI0022B04550|nr:non-ribosomal peptide synthetase [Streptomyces sp. H39-C1]MCZ4102334.1 non-ribosomal peptide synthetase [Streptomyces sp. H39-C1]